MKIFIVIFLYAGMETLYGLLFFHVSGKGQLEETNFHHSVSYWHQQSLFSTERVHWNFSRSVYEDKNMNSPIMALLSH